jgi:hypothetical protein
MAGEITRGVSDNARDNNYSAKAKEAFEWLKGWGESVFDTVTGKAVFEKVAEYLQESEAVNTALATRIYDLLDRETRMLERLAAVEKTSKRHAYWLSATSVVSVASIGLILYLVIHRS